MTGAAIATIAAFLFPGRSWGGVAVKGLAMLIVGLFVALLLTGLYRDWRNDIVSAALAKERARYDRKLLDAWSKASEELARKDEEKARIANAWSQRLLAEQLRFQELNMENAALQDALESSGVDGRQIR